MSHLFISYSHADAIHLTNFVDKLKNSGFKDHGEDKDIWIDASGIEGGEEWREEIDKALEESFAVVILLTTNSVKSTFVLYEWAWALGNNVRVIPILVEEISDLPPDFKHPLYERKQYKNWNSQSDQELIITQLKDLNQLSPLDAFLGIAISEIILPAQILSHVLLWCYQYTNPNHILSHKDFCDLLQQTVYEINACYMQKLRDFWLDKSSAFKRSQKRLYSKLIKDFEHFWDVLTTFQFVIQTGFQEDISFFRYKEKSLSELIIKLADFRQRIDITISTLNANPIYVKEFYSYLTSISTGKYTQNQLKEIRFFSTIEYTFKSLSEEQRYKVEQVIELVIQQMPTE